MNEMITILFLTINTLVLCFCVVATVVNYINARSWMRFAERQDKRMAEHWKWLASNLGKHVDFYTDPEKPNVIYMKDRKK